MQLPIKAHYATVAMVALAQSHSTGVLGTVRAIADEHQIPQQFLVQIFQQLRAAGMITSLRGSSGGYRLTKTPDEISLADILDAVCPCGTATVGTCGSIVSDAVQSVWIEIDEAQRELLTRWKLSELAQRAAARSDTMFYI